MDPLVTDDILVGISRHRLFGNDGKNFRKKRKRGSGGGIQQRLKCQKLRRISLLSIILANVQSLRNKSDELQAKTYT